MCYKIKKKDIRIYRPCCSGKMDPVIYGLSSKTTSYWPGLRIPLNCTTDEGAAFTYTIKESSREGAIEIDEDGIVTVHKAGYFTITATAAPTAHYNGGSRDIEVNVSKCGIDSITDIDAVTTAVYNPDGISFPVNSVTLKDMRSNTLPLVKGTDYDISLSTDTPCAGENVQATFHITLKGIAAERYDMNNTLLRGPGIHMNVKVNPIAQPLHTTEAADNLPTLCKGGAAVDLSAFVENETGNAVSFDVPEGTTLTDGHILKISSGYAGSTAVVTARSAAYDVNGDGTPEYGEASVPLTFPVTAKAEAALTGIRMADWIYGETASDVSYDAVAGAGETAVSYEGIKGTAYGPSDAKPANAGKYRVTVSTQTDTCIYTGSTTFAIAKKAIDLSAAVWNYDPRSPFTYDGTPKTVTVTLPDGAAVDSYSGNTRTDAGSSLTASATVKLADGYSADNYELVGILPTCGWKINKKSVSGIEFPVETVYGESGSEIELRSKENGICTFIMPDSPVSVEAAFMEDNTMLNCFVDIPAGAYYYDAVLWAAQNRITGGVDAIRFSPGAACTRAQAVTLLWRAAGSLEVPAGRTFDDVVSGSYYEKAVVWALANGITSGTSASAFSPDAVCTRAQIVTFLARFAGGTASSAVRFSDVPADAYYAGAAAWAVENHITDGIGGNQFAPDAACTRAQIVTFLYRYLHK